jgi:L-aminopeptidase/D-esterase-like protein
MMKEIKITDITGVKIGHAQDTASATGCTVIICEKGASGGVDVRGGAPASRETELLKSENMVDKVHAVVLSGGSAYGLDACSGVMQFLEEKGVGFEAKDSVVPIVCGASLFDLSVGNSAIRPDKSMGYEACKSAERGDDALLEGNFGAGTGAACGKYFGTDRMMKSGLGIYAASIGNVKCAAIVSVNALGDVFDTQTGEQIAGLLSEDKTKLESTILAMYDEIETEKNVFSSNTTIGCIITNVKMTKVQCNKLASVTHNAFARAIRPTQTSFDGDTIFVMSTDEVVASTEALGVLATEIMEKAIANAVRKAKPAYGLVAQSQI